MVKQAWSLYTIQSEILYVHSFKFHLALITQTKHIPNLFHNNAFSYDNDLQSKETRGIHQMKE